MRFLGSGEVIIDHAASFGINVGHTTYTGPLIENFGTAAKIDLKDVASSGAVLGSTFQACADGTNHLLLTRV